MKSIDLPYEYTKRMEALLGSEYDDYLASFEKPWSRGLRVNEKKIAAGAFPALCGRSLRPVPWIRNGFYQPDDWQASKDPLYYAGLYYLQEPSAMTPASCLPVEPGDRVLDLCAAPGGKATELGARLKGRGLLWANDISASRARALLKNLELWGIPNICVTGETPERLAQALPEFFDKILVDAPCSGEGMFRKEPEMVKDWMEKGPAYYAPIQREILLQAASMLRPGGYLLYSTCTFSPEEDEANAEFLLENVPELSLVPLPIFEGASPGFGLPGVLRLFPHKINGEGHFLALFQKKERPDAVSAVPKTAEWSPVRKSSEEKASRSRRNTAGRNTAGRNIAGRNTAGRNTAEKSTAGKIAAEKKEADAREAFLHFSDALNLAPGDGLAALFNPERLSLIGENLYAIPPGFPETGGLRILRSGLLLGQARRGRFEPSQALAMALKPDQISASLHLPYQDERVIRYLKGESVDAGPEGGREGWRLICLDEFPLGWAKDAGRFLKNKYYPGWRYV